MKKLTLGRKVYILTPDKSIHEGYIFGYYFSLMAVLSYMKLPGFRILIQLIYEAIKRVIIEPKFIVANFLDIKPLALILMRKIASIDFKDMASYLSIIVKVAIKNGELTKVISVPLSRVFDTASEAKAKAESYEIHLCNICQRLLSVDEYHQLNGRCKVCNEMIKKITNIKSRSNKVVLKALVRAMQVRVREPHIVRVNTSPKLTEGWEKVQNIDEYIRRTPVKSSIPILSYYNKKDIQRKADIRNTFKRYLSFLKGEITSDELKKQSLNYDENIENQLGQIKPDSTSMVIINNETITLDEALSVGIDCVLDISNVQFNLEGSKLYLQRSILFYPCKAENYYRQYELSYDSGKFNFENIIRDPLSIEEKKIHIHFPFLNANEEIGQNILKAILIAGNGNACIALNTIEVEYTAEDYLDLVIPDATIVLHNVNDAYSNFPEYHNNLSITTINYLTSFTTLDKKEVSYADPLLVRFALVNKQDYLNTRIEFFINGEKSGDTITLVDDGKRTLDFTIPPELIPSLIRKHNIFKDEKRAIINLGVLVTPNGRPSRYTLFKSFVLSYDKPKITLSASLSTKEIDFTKNSSHNVNLNLEYTLFCAKSIKVLGLRIGFSPIEGNTITKYIYIKNEKFSALEVITVSNNISLPETFFPKSGQYKMKVDLIYQLNYQNRQYPTINPEIEFLGVGTSYEIQENILGTLDANDRLNVFVVNVTKNGEAKTDEVLIFSLDTAVLKNLFYNARYLFPEGIENVPKFINALNTSFKNSKLPGLGDTDIPTNIDDLKQKLEDAETNNTTFNFQVGFTFQQPIDDPMEDFKSFDNIYESTNYTTFERAINEELEKDEIFKKTKIKIEKNKDNIYLISLFFRNYCEVPFELGTTVWFLKQVGGNDSPVHLIYKGILNSVEYTTDVSLKKFDDVELSLFVSDYRAEVIASLIPSLTESLPAELPHDILSTYTVDKNKLYLSFKEAKANSIWIYCPLCNKFKVPLIEYNTAKDLIDFLVYITSMGSQGDDKLLNGSVAASKDEIENFATDSYIARATSSRIYESYKNLVSKDYKDIDAFINTNNQNKNRELLQPLSNMDNKIQEDISIIGSNDPFKKDTLSYGETSSKLADYSTSKEPKDTPLVNIQPSSDLKEIMNSKSVLNPRTIAMAVISNDKQFKSLVKSYNINKSNADNNMADLLSKLSIGSLDLYPALGAIAEHVSICPECLARMKKNAKEFVEWLTPEYISNVLFQYAEIDKKSFDIKTYIDTTFENQSAKIIKSFYNTEITEPERKILIEYLEKLLSEKFK
jgi:hypothetical protein